ncbi:hypothetical protein ACM61V_15375 [Sphingomonas sp. TX0543]|uniref:hypothetical protein n=1 Tax=unclassified Sphingomonas TaxID=196159 RepID=UPI0010F7DF8B|nr:hypothetical protein [Sphingomonas sp. 3P27F8]
MTEKTDRAQPEPSVCSPLSQTAALGICTGGDVKQRLVARSIREFGQEADGPNLLLNHRSIGADDFASANAFDLLMLIRRRVRFSQRRWATPPITLWTGIRRT